MIHSFTDKMQADQRILFYYYSDKNGRIEMKAKKKEFQFKINENRFDLLDHVHSSPVYVLNDLVLDWILISD